MLGLQKRVGGGSSTGGGGKGQVPKKAVKRMDLGRLSLYEDKEGVDEATDQVLFVFVYLFVCWTVCWSVCSHAGETAKRSSALHLIFQIELLSLKWQQQQQKFSSADASILLGLRQRSCRGWRESRFGRYG